MVDSSLRSVTMNKSLYKYYVGHLSSFDIDLIWTYCEFRGWPYSHIPIIDCRNTDRRFFYDFFVQRKVTCGEVIFCLSVCLHFESRSTWRIFMNLYMSVVSPDVLPHSYILCRIWSSHTGHYKGYLWDVTPCNKVKIDRAVAQAVSRWLPTAAARVRVRGVCVVCCGQSGIGADFLRVLRFPLPIIPPISPSL
jgi:hypothetical protein